MLGGHLIMTSSTIDHRGIEHIKSAPTKMDSSDAKITDAEWKKFANEMQIVNPYRIKQYLGHSCNRKFLKRFLSSAKATRNLRIAAKLGKTDMVKVLLELGRSDVNNTDKAGQTALHYAAREGHLEIVDMLLAKPNINTSLCDGNRNTALHIAAKHGHVRVFEKILRVEPKVDPNSINVFGETPLALAARRGHEKIVDILLEKPELVGTKEQHESTPSIHDAAKHDHADILQSPLHFGVEGGHETKVDTLEDDTGTPLHEAARNGHEAIVRKLLEDLWDVNSTNHSKQKSPLHLAAEGGHETVVDWLLEAPLVNPSLKDSNGNTPLHIAAKEGNGAIFEKLLQMPVVDVTSSNEKGMTALHVAAKYKHANIVTMLLEKANVDPCAKATAKDKTPLRMASKFGGFDVVQVLLATNVDPCLGDNCGDTPLHLAAKSGHRDIAERLLAEPHLDMVNKVNKQNETPLFLAARHGFVDVVDLLLEIPEVDLSICDNYGDSPFHTAVKGGHANIAEKLITYPRAIPLYANQEKVTALHLCIRGGHENLVDILLEQSIEDASAKDANGDFPIHYAAQNGNVYILGKILEALKALNACGVDVNSVNDHLDTALHVAVRAGHVVVVEELLGELDLKVDMRDGDGNLPLHVAAKYDEEEMIEKLLEAPEVDVNDENEGGVTALVLAAEEGHECFVNKLLERKDPKILNSAKEGEREPSKFNWGIRSLLIAARNGHDTIVESLLVEDVNVNGADPSVHSALQGAIQGFRHKTALSEAIEHGRKKVVEKLLGASYIDPNRRNGNGEHPLFIAAKHGHKDIIDMLLDHKKGLIDVNVISNRKTALHGAAKAGREQVVKTLLNSPDIDVHIKNTDDGETALFYAARADNKTILKAIFETSKGNVGSEKYTIQTRLSINAKNLKGESIIHLAAQEKLLNVFDFLLDVEHDDARGVDVNLKTGKEGDGLSALQIAIKAAMEPEIEAKIKVGYYKVVEKLMKFDSISFIQEKEGETFLQHIFEEEQWETFSIVTKAPQVAKYIEALYQDRQASVDAANAILVGAALIAGVTFASWLQPPLGYTTYYHEQFSDTLPAPPVAYPDYASFDHHPSLQAFWVFNSLSFFTGIATVISGARTVLPYEKSFIKQEVEDLQKNLLKTSILLCFSMFFVLLAFATAGVVVLPPVMKFKANIYCTIAIGGSLCLMFLFSFGRNIQKLLFNIYHFQPSRKPLR